MGNFNRDNRSRGRDSRGDSRGDSGGFGRRDGGRSGGFNKQMHQATCADCGNSCEVPFRPTGDKPVYCNNCFRNHRGDDSGQQKRSGKFRKEYGQSVPRQSQPSSVDLDKINRKLDAIMKMLSGGKREQAAEESVKAPEKVTKKVEKKKPAKKAKKSSAKKTAPTKKKKK